MNDDDFRMTDTQVSCPALVIQVKNIPDEGMNIKGEIPLRDLDIRDDGRFFPEDAMLSFAFHVAAARQDIIVTGSFSAEFQGICDRCAESAPLSIQENQVFHRYKNNMEQPVDLTEDIREDILLTFPQIFLCSEDCLGLCGKCGHNLNDGPCGCPEEDIEPFEGDEERPDPWAVFDNLDLKD